VQLAGLGAEAQADGQGVQFVVAHRLGIGHGRAPSKNGGQFNAGGVAQRLLRRRAPARQFTSSLLL
jgi:hypothetical protein